MQLELTYPNFPGWKRTGTSSQAAKEIAPRVPAMKARIQNLLIIYGPMTADECAERMKKDVLSVRPRFTELAKLNLIKPTGETRKTRFDKDQDVYRAVV